MQKPHNDRSIMEKIYDFGRDNVTVFPDATFLRTDKPEMARFLIAKSDNVLFPEAANKPEAAEELKKVLTEIQNAAQDPEFKPSLESVVRFGIQKGAEPVVSEIMNRYVKICRDKRAKEQVFGPGVQYNFHKFSNDGIEVTLSNYGLLFATLQQASFDPGYKKFLTEQGQSILGSRTGFFVNLPGTTTVLECLDGITFVNRGPTAEWQDMYGIFASGHHSPEKTMKDATEIMVNGKPTKAITLEKLASYQIETETGYPMSAVEDFKMLGFCFSTGYELAGTEKVEVYASARIPKTGAELFAQMQQKAPHKWETARLYIASPEAFGKVIELSLDSRIPLKGLANIQGLQAFGASEQMPKTDPNSVSYWCPVHLTGLLTHIGPEFYAKHMPERWQINL